MGNRFAGTKLSKLREHWQLIGAIAIVVVLSVVIVLRFGFEDLAPDDGTYLYAGRTVLDGELPSWSTGDFYDRRSPVFPVVLAVSDLVDWDDYLGPHVVVWALGVIGLAGAVGIAGRIGGGPAALGTAAALAITPAIWMTIPSLRVDLALTTGVVATIATLLRPSLRRWALAGFLVGVTILLKETSALLVLLPLAWIRTIGNGIWLRLTAVYLGIAGITISWWWALVWIESREMFGIENADRVAGETFDRPFSLDLAAWVLVAAFAVGWLVFAIRSRGDARPRTVTVAGIALLLPAAYAWDRHLALRQFVPLAVISSIALGVVVGTTIARLVRRRGWGLALAVAACFTITGVAATSLLHQEATNRRANLAVPLAAWLEPSLAPEDVIVTNRFSNSQLSYELYGTFVPRFPTVSRAEVQLDEFAWLGKFQDDFIGTTRSDLVELVAKPDVRYLIFIGPHRTAAPELVSGLSSPPGLPGISRVHEVRDDRQYAVIFAIDPDTAARRIADLPLQMSADAALLWLDRQGAATSADDARQRFLAADPTVYGAEAERAALAERLGTTMMTSVPEARNGPLLSSNCRPGSSSDVTTC